jgi:hypothetical protein
MVLDRCGDMPELRNGIRTYWKDRWTYRYVWVEISVIASVSSLQKTFAFTFSLPQYGYHTYQLSNPSHTTSPHIENSRGMVTINKTYPHQTSFIAEDIP